VYRIQIKVLFIKSKGILLKLRAFKRNASERYASEEIHLKKRVWRKRSWRHVISSKLIRSKVIRSISSEASSPELTKYSVRSVQPLTLACLCNHHLCNLSLHQDKNNNNIAADVVPFQMEWIWNWFFIGQLSNQAKDQWWRIEASSKTSWCNS